MLITVLNIFEARDTHKNFDAVVSLVDQKSWVNFSHPHHKVGVFADIEDPRVSSAPKYDQIAEIMDWAAALDPKTNLLVHCYAGQCRSTAMAIAIAVLHGATPADAYMKLIKIHPDGRLFWPNSLVLRHAEKYLYKHYKNHKGMTEDIQRLSTITGGLKVALLGMEKEI